MAELALADLALAVTWLALAVTQLAVTGRSWAVTAELGRDGGAGRDRAG